MKIIVFGGSGNLGTELKKLDAEILCPSRSEVDIRNLDEVIEYVYQNKPDIVINAAAETDNRVVEKKPDNAISTNIIGAANVSMTCLNNNIRLVYLSTDYVYEGDRGNYKEVDPVKPFNLYSWTKLGGECSAVAVKNHLIIRTSFGKRTFDYPEAFTDKWSSKDYVDKIAPLIYEASISPLTGVLNLGTERKTLYAHATERNKGVEGVKIEDTNYFTPYDTSLNLQKWINYKSSKSIAKPHCNCRVCGSKDLVKYLDLGLMPLANNLEFTAVRAKEKERFPLQVMFCQDCGLSQLSVVIDPVKMFGSYTYRSSVNAPYIKHCREMAESLKEKYDLSSESFHVDIAGNDGTLLKEFRSILNHKVLNVDPATNLVAIAESQGIESVADFWSSELSLNINENHGQADLITATNVFAHLHDVKDFILGAYNLLKEDGVLVIENPYMIDFIDNMEFGSVYFEHTQYWSLLPLEKLCSMLDMVVIDAEKQDIHCGSMRYTIAKNTSKYQVSDRVTMVREQEINKGLNTVEAFSGWGFKVDKLINDFGTNLLKLKREGLKIGAFAASAKGNTLLNSAGINTDIISWIADDTPEKINKFSPGTGIPILHPQIITKDTPDCIVILSWNFTDAIIKRVRSLGYKGKFILPCPEFKIID